MKHSLSYCLILYLALASCKPKNEYKNIEESETLTTSQTTDTLPCFTSYQVFTETAFLWQASWVSYYNRFKGGRYNDSPRVSFDEQSLNGLYNEVKNEVHPGVLMWYTLLDQNDSIPSLAIQNTIACKIDPAGTILLASGNDPTLTVDNISQEYLDSIKHNWHEVGEQNPAVYTEVNGYNYEWDSIQNLMNLSTGPQAIYIHYGLRTIEPDESANYATSTDPDKTGSIIYCNVIYGNTFEVNPTATLLDFAMPCPTFCGDN